MNNIQQTSADVYHEQVKPHLGAKQREVYFALRARADATNKELSRAMGLEINCITPRIMELREMGYVRESCKRPCKISGNKAIAWCVAKGLF